EDVRNGILTDTFNNVQWFDHLFRTAPMQNHTVSLAGGNQAVKFQGNIGYLNQDGIMLGTSVKRYNYRVNVSTMFSKLLSGGFMEWGYMKKKHEPATAVNTIMNYANMALPITPVKFSNVNWGVFHPTHEGGNDPARV